MITITKVVTRNFILDIVAQIQNLVGMNLTSYEKMVDRGIINPFIELKERKLVSLKRQSRAEVVNVARSPDQNIIEGKEERGILKRFFSPQKRA